MDCFPKTSAPVELSYFSSCFSLILSLVTIFGNSLIIISIWKDPFKRFRTPFIYFLVNLALSDLCYGLVPMIVSTVIHFKEALTGAVDFTEAALIHMTYFICATASVTSTGILVLDRYFAITWPIKYREKLTFPRCLIISILIWIFSIGISFIYLKVGYITYLMLFVHSSVVFTVAIAIFCYLHVCKELVKANLMEPSNTTESRRLLREKVTTRAFMWILFVYIALYTPAILIIYILYFNLTCSCTVRHVLRDLQFLIISTNPAINPFICAIRLKSFRDSILHISPFKNLKLDSRRNTRSLSTSTVYGSPTASGLYENTTRVKKRTSIKLTNYTTRQNVLDNPYGSA